MRVAVIQSSYIPWKGFFDLIGRCDEYVIYDSMQYVKRHWHNRNRIKTANGVEWLTIPVITKGRFEQRIDEVEIEKPWADKHWRALELAYRRAAFFDRYAATVRQWYERADSEGRLTDVNAIFLRGIAGARRQERPNRNRLFDLAFMANLDICRALINQANRRSLFTYV